MGLIVQKFGGSSVADADRIRNVARIITETYRRGHRVVAVLSAQGDTTDDLIAKAAEINPNASKREMDMLLSTGEQISCSLCAMAIEAMGYPVVSLTGWQAGFRTNSSYGDARIKRIDTERVLAELDKNTIVIVTGFQGLNKYEDITTLGRGGSDTSAVALAAVLHADLCQIYTDVDGVYTADPRHVKGRGSWRRSPTTRCWSWPPWAPRCSTTVRLRWPSATASTWRSSPAFPASPAPKSRRLQKPWKNCTSAA